MKTEWAGVSVDEAGNNLRTVFSNLPGMCSVAEFESNPDRYLCDWIAGTMGLYVDAKAVRM